MSILNGKKILLGVSGGIAIYKAVDFVSKARKCGAEVRVVMTKNAAQMVSPLTFETISQNSATLDLFSPERGFQIEHIANAKWGDLFLIAPATADVVGKLAHGIADDALTTLFLAFDKPVFISPSMNPAMWHNRAVKENIEILRGRGVNVINPATGATACGDEGAGRLPEPHELILRLEEFLSSQALLAGKKVLATAGPTREFFDPVRCITNPSSGKMGYAMAAEAARLGAEVVLISGPSSLCAPSGVKTIKVKTAQTMLKSVMGEIKGADYCVFAAAVSDYRPETSYVHKLKKSDESITIKLVKNPDIALEASKKKKAGMVFVGFAAETEDFIRNALDKMQKKKFDYIAVNNVLDAAIGFESQNNEVVLINKRGDTVVIARASKEEVAKNIWSNILQK